MHYSEEVEYLKCPRVRARIMEDYANMLELLSQESLLIKKRPVLIQAFINEGLKEKVRGLHPRFRISDLLKDMLNLPLTDEMRERKNLINNHIKEVRIRVEILKKEKQASRQIKRVHHKEDVIWIKGHMGFEMISGIIVSELIELQKLEKKFNQKQTKDEGSNNGSIAGDDDPWSGHTGD